MPFGLKKGIWVLSAKWARVQLDCTVPGIINKCHAGCCRAPYWPATATEGDDCYYLGPRGCKLKRADRPVHCLLYPFVVHKNKLVFHQKALVAPCAKCREAGPPILEALKGSFTVLFGEGMYRSMMRDMWKGRDTFFVPSEAMVEQYLHEKEWKEKNNVYPRS